MVVLSLVEGPWVSLVYFGPWVPVTPVQIRAVPVFLINDPLAAQPR